MAAESIYKGMSLTECTYACMHHLQSYNSSGMNLSGSTFVVGVLFAAAIASTAALRSCDTRGFAFYCRIYSTVTVIGVNGSKCQTPLEQMYQAPVKVGKLLLRQGGKWRSVKVARSKTKAKFEYTSVHLYIHIQFYHCK